MGLDYGTPFLEGRGIWKNMQAIRTAGLPIDLFYKEHQTIPLPSNTDTVVHKEQVTISSAYVTDMMVHMFHLVSDITQGGERTATLGELCNAYACYVNRAFQRFSVCVLCNDDRDLIPLSKRPIQAKRRSKHQPLSQSQFKRLKEHGEITNWNQIRSTPGARAWIMQQVEIFLTQTYEMPTPKVTQKSLTLIIHGMIGRPQEAFHMEIEQGKEVEKGVIDVPLIGEGEVQLTYWLNFISRFMPVVGVSIDKDMIALGLLNTLRRDTDHHNFPVYTFRNRKLFHTIVETPAARREFMHRPYQSCPDFTIAPVYDPKKKISDMPFLDMNGFAREIEAMFLYHQVNVTSPHATWVLFMAFVGCDFVDKNVLYYLNGEKLFEGYLSLGQYAPSVVRLTLESPSEPFRIEFAEKDFLNFVFTFLENYNKGKKKGCVFKRIEVIAAARRACWVLSYWSNAILGTEYVPKTTLLDDKGRSYWGWTDVDMIVKETTNITKRLPPGQTQIVKKIDFRKRLRSQEPIDSTLKKRKTLTA